MNHIIRPTKYNTLSSPNPDLSLVHQTAYLAQSLDMPFLQIIILALSLDKTDIHHLDNRKIVASFLDFHNKNLKFVQGQNVESQQKMD